MVSCENKAGRCGREGESFPSGGGGGDGRLRGKLLVVGSKERGERKMTKRAGAFNHNAQAGNNKQR